MHARGTFRIAPFLGLKELRTHAPVARTAPRWAIAVTAGLFMAPKKHPLACVRVLVPKLVARSGARPFFGLGKIPLVRAHRRCVREPCD